jgi:molybdate transport repressor ModE-like protein
MAIPYDLADLELRHLLALRAIAESGTFWAAAENLGCSQSALSQQIATIERLLGCPLIDRRRGKRSVSMTEAGRLLLKHAEVIVARLRAVHADFTAFAEGGAGMLRVGTFESSGTRLLPPLLRRFRRSWPAVEVRLTEVAKDDRLLELVEQGELDLTFAVLPLPEGPFDSHLLMRDPFVLVVAHDAPLTLKKRKSVPLDQVQRLPLIGFGAGRSMEQAEAHMKGLGLALNIVFRSNYNGTVQGLVAAGMGAAIAPLLTVDLRRPDTRVLGPVEAIPPRRIALAWHKDRYRSPAALAFIETATEVSAGLERAAASEKRH